MTILKHARVMVLGTIALTGTAIADTPNPDEPITTDTTIDPNATPPPPPPVVVEPPAVNNSTTIVEPTTYESQDTTRSGNALERYGIAVALGGGVEDFASKTIRDTTQPGGMWNVRVGVGTHAPIGFEGAYVGSAQSIEALGIDTNALLVGNGVEGKVRLNLLDRAIQPFAFAGLGWTHYSLQRTDTNTSAISDSDDVLEVPMGLGLAYKTGGFLFDTRGEFRYAAQEDLMPALNNPDDQGTAAMHRWSVNANVGYSF